MEAPGPTPAQSRAAHRLEELLGRHGLCWQDAALQEDPVLCKTAAPEGAARAGPRVGEDTGPEHRRRGCTAGCTHAVATEAAERLFLCLMSLRK